MDKLIKRIVNIAVIVLAVVAAVAGLYIALKGGKFAKNNPTSLNISFYITYIMFFAILALLAFFVILQVFSSKKTMITTFILLAVGAVITLFSYYALADAQLSDVALKVGVSETIYRWSSTGLYVSYIVFFGVIAAFLGSLIYINIKKR
jgi:uncharacterized membrane protein